MNREQGKEIQMKVEDTESRIVTDSDMNESVCSESLNSRGQQNKLD